MAQTTQDTAAKTASARPLSPHLQIYRWQMTMTMSILHRATGVALTFGLFIMAWWLLAAASGPEAYETFRTLAATPLGILCAVGISYALIYHTCSGLRHLIWDTGKFLNIPGLYKTGYTALVASVILTALFWLAIVM